MVAIGRLSLSSRKLSPVSALIGPASIRPLRGFRASLVWFPRSNRLTRSVAFLSRVLEAGVDVRFADLPQIEGATGRFLLQKMVAVAELEAGMISTRTKARLRWLPPGSGASSWEACAATPRVRSSPAPQRLAQRARA